MARTRIRPFSAEALWKVQRVGSPALSPDGRIACATVTAYDMGTDEGTTSLWLFPVERGAQRARRLTTGAKDAAPAFSPDGRSIAFTAKRKDDEVEQLYLIPVDGGEARRVTQLATGVKAFRWFPDGRRVALISWVWPDLSGDAAQQKRLKARSTDKVKAHVTERNEYRYWDHWLSDGREPHLFVCDIATGRCRDLFAGRGLRLRPWQPDLEEFDVSPDGREIAFTFDPADQPGMMNQTDIVTLDVATRRFRNLTAGSGMSDEHPRYSPDGASIAWHAFDTRRAFNDQGHLRVMPRRGGAWKRVGADWDRATLQLDWTPDSKALLFLTEDQGRVGLYRLPLQSAVPTLVAGGGVIGGYACSRDAKVVVFDRSTSAYPPRLFALDGGGERAIERLNERLLASHDLGETREFWIRGHAGERVQMFVTYPPGFDPKRKWPLMHSIHGGPHAAHHDGWHFRWNTQVFAAQGRVVAAVNYHGSSGYGQRFIESITGRYGVKEMADIEAGTDYLLSRGYVDRTRLTATGGSYGGFMVAWMNGHTHRYRAYVCHAGCYDWVSMMATDGWRFFAAELSGFHWERGSKVMASSPHQYIGAARTPTLVVHGELDYRVPATQGLQYYDSLKARDVPARLVYFPDENHWILKPQNSRLWHREFFAWLDRYDKPRARANETGSARPRRGAQKKAR